jgi:hypothetical protein
MGPPSPKRPSEPTRTPTSLRTKNGPSGLFPDGPFDFLASESLRGQARYFPGRTTGLVREAEFLRDFFSDPLAGELRKLRRGHRPV